MKKIMFNDKFLLTDAVEAEKKTMTRRIAHLSQHNADILMGKIPTCPQSIVDAIWFESRYKIGEVVAVAQNYKSINDFYEIAYKRYNSFHGQIVTKYDISFKEIVKWFELRESLKDTAGWTNKMFVKADLMPHHIKITGIKVERLQDISDEDCLKEGIIHAYTNNDGIKIYYTPHTKRGYLSTDVAQQAFAFLIDKVSGKGTWESNPFVFAYEFVLVD